MSQIQAKEPTEDLVSFEREFANDPDKAEWSEFGAEAKQTFDSPDKAIQGVSLSVRLHNLMQKGVQRLGDAYRRKNFVKRADLVLTAFHVPSSVKANQLIPIVWVMKLDQSIPSAEPGKPRSWAGSTSNPAWFGGNLSFESLRTLASLIQRVSDKEGRQMDEWDYKAGWEPYAREYVKQLRASELSLSGLKRLIEMRENEIAAEAKRQAESAMTPDDIKRSKEADAVVERNKKIEKLGGDLLTSFSTALKDIKMGKDEFTKLLRDKQMLDVKAIAPEPARPTPADFVKGMTPGDAKALVEAIVESIPSDPMRYATILKTLTRACQDAVKQMKSASEDVKSAAA